MLNKRFVAVELFSAAVCNLNCNYCYIPKVKELSIYHKNVLKSIKDDTFLNKLIESYGTNLECISHWGTEPTLTLQTFIDSKFYDKAVQAFPKLTKVSMSSNFMENTKILVNFIKSFPKTPMNFGIQLSLDGPDYITDKNRISSATETIVKNIILFIREINKLDINHNIDVHFKPTHYKDEIYLLNDWNEVIKYCDFFENVLVRMIEANVNHKVNINTVCSPTLVYPGTYTKSDGEKYTTYIEHFVKVHQSKMYKNAIFKSQIMYNIESLTKNINLIHVGQTQVGCSAGRSQYAISEKGNFMPCHRNFYMDNDDLDIFKGCKDDEYTSGYDLDRKTLLKKFISKDMILQSYVLAGYHDFHKFKMSAVYAMVQELSLSGLISSRFQSDYIFAQTFCYFLLMRSCLADGQFITGSIHLTPASMAKIYGNGAFELIYNLYVGSQT